MIIKYTNWYAKCSSIMQYKCIDIFFTRFNTKLYSISCTNYLSIKWFLVITHLYTIFIIICWAEYIVIIGSKCTAILFSNPYIQWYTIYVYDQVLIHHSINFMSCALIMHHHTTNSSQYIGTYMRLSLINIPKGASSWHPSDLPSSEISV